MRYQQTITVPEAESIVRSRIFQYMSGHGYTRDEAQPGVLVYRRGLRVGSWLAFRPKDWKVQVTFQLDPPDAYQTQVGVTFDLDTVGQWVTSKERKYWNGEARDLIAALGGTVVPAAEMGLRGEIDSELRLEKQAHSGSDWFFWIAGLSLINSVMYALGQNVTFVVGLGATQVVDGVAGLLIEDIGPGGGKGIILVIAVVLDLFIAGIFLLGGVLGRRRIRWAMIAGMVLYLLDGLILLVAQDYLGVLFHLVALAGLFSGLQAMGKLVKLEAAAPSTPTTIGLAR